MAPGIAEYLGVHPRFVDGTMTGGSSYEIHVEHAAAAIAAGLCEVVVGVYAATPRGDRARKNGGGRPGPDAGTEPDARVGDAVRVADADGRVRARREPAHGRVRHDLGAARADRGRHAALGVAEPERAATAIRSPIDDVLASPMQASPLHLLDCCLVTDGAGAFVMTSAARGSSLAKPPVYVLGAASCTDHSMITAMPDLAVTAGAVSGPAAFAQAGITPADVDLLMGYDSLHDHRAVAPRRSRVLRQG